MHLLVGNIKNNPRMPQLQVIEDLKKAEDNGNVVILNEIGPWRYRHAVRTIFSKKNGWFNTNGNDATNMFVCLRSNKFTVTNVKVLPLHKGYRLVTPSRELLIVETVTSDGIPIVFIAWHFVNAAWNLTWRPRKQLRRKLWLESYATLKEVVQRYEDEGIIIVGAGDINKEQIEPFTRNTSVYGGKSIVKATVSCRPVKYKAFLNKHFTITDVNTDHPLQAFHITLFFRN